LSDPRRRASRPAHAARAVCWVGARLTRPPGTPRCDARWAGRNRQRELRMVAWAERALRHRLTGNITGFVTYAQF